MKKLFLLIILVCVSTFIHPIDVKAYGECSEYGAMVTYDYYSNTCQCMSGYVFSSKYGIKQCVSADSICTDKYGYNSRYNSLDNSCECSYGYVFGKDSIGRTQCVSPDSMCRDKLGYASSYNSLYDQCECDYGYFIKGGQCVHGNNTCRTEHGLYSSYNNSSNRCECDDGYTLDDYGQCVEKQNNVYFTLKELDTDEKKAIVKSDYDYKYYLITYNSGCYASSFRRYLNHQIVINLGTDFYLDTWDKIVLQDDDETCDITHKEYADSNTTLVPEEEPVYYFIPEPIPTPPPAVKKPQIQTSKATAKTSGSQVKTIVSTSKPDVLVKNTDSKIKTNNPKTLATTSSSTTTNPIKSGNSVLKRFGTWFKNLFK